MSEMGRRRLASFWRLPGLTTKRCPYCDGPGPFTREHIWPDWVHRETGYGVNFSSRAGKVLHSALVIRDVCKPCNNIALSGLDDHAAALYRSHFEHWVSAGQRVTFRYDHGRLLRWLLKVSFNSARTTGQDAAILGRYRHVIGSPHDCTPTSVFVAVRTIRPAYKNENGLIVPVQPRGARCGRIIVPGHDGDTRFVTRMISLNAYFFSIFLLEDDAMPPEEFASMIHRFGTPLTPDGVTLIPAPSMDTAEAMRGVENWPGL